RDGPPGVTRGVVAQAGTVVAGTVGGGFGRADEDECPGAGWVADVFARRACAEPGVHAFLGLLDRADGDHPGSAFARGAGVRAAGRALVADAPDSGDLH